VEDMELQSPLKDKTIIEKKSAKKKKKSKTMRTQKVIDHEQLVHKYGKKASRVETLDA
jgi:hypothetical protein